jgi:hypothetical protein
MPPRKTPAKRSKSPKTTDKTSVGQLVPQPHGGALRNGGTNKGGPGRPASEVIARALGSFDERIPVLEEIADNAAAADADRIRAVDKLAKYGLVDGISRADVRAALSDTVDAIRRVMGPDGVDELLAEIRGFWTKL